jgi:hypothetical protein
MRATSPAHLVLRDLNTLIIVFGEMMKLLTKLLSSRLSYTDFVLSSLLPDTLSLCYHTFKFVTL